MCKNRCNRMLHRIFLGGASYRWTVTSVYTGFVLLVCLIPLPSREGGGLPHADKLIHAALWGCLALLLLWTLHIYDLSRWRRAGTVFCLAFIVGVTVEVLQFLLPFGRMFSGLDVLADVAGIVLFTAAGMLFSRVSNR